MINGCSDLQTAFTQLLVACASLVGVFIAAYKASHAARDSSAVRKVAENGNGTSGSYAGAERRFLSRRVTDRENRPTDAP